MGALSTNINMKLVHELGLIFLLFSSIYGDEEIGNEGDELFTEEFPFVKDCKDVPDSFVLNSNDVILEDTLITQWYKWNVKIYDINTTYTDENRISDVNDMINGYFFSMKLFKKQFRGGFTPRDIEIQGEIFEIIRGFKKHFHHTAASQNYSPATMPKSDEEYLVQIQFPTNT